VRPVTRCGSRVHAADENARHAPLNGFVHDTESPEIIVLGKPRPSLVISSGLLNRPKLPGIPGIKTFKGHSFHTSRWDYGYTGGSTEGGLTRLADKQVAIVGAAERFR
jgi:cation diffusion facilitator CzcD-associated flavoprotein CzcO